MNNEIIYASIYLNSTAQTFLNANTFDIKVVNSNIAFVFSNSYITSSGGVESLTVSMQCEENLPTSTSSIGYL